MEAMAVEVVIGLDVGKASHHAVALDRQGGVLLDQVVANDEAALRALLARCRGRGTAVLVVDQPASIGALPVAVAQAIGLPVGYVPGLTMRRMADLFPGLAKTDRRDARLIAEAARRLPDTVRGIGPVDAQVADVRQLAGHDADLVQRHTALINQVRGLLTQVHPALERVLGPRLDRRGVLELLAAAPTPAQLVAAGADGIAACLRQHGSRIADRLAGTILTAVAAQTVVIDGTGGAALILPFLVSQVLAIRAQRQLVAAQIATRLADEPLFAVVQSLPGVGPRIATTVVVETAGKVFPSAAHLAAYAGIAPVTWRSGASVRGERATRNGNTVLKDALFQAAFAALAHPPSRAYYERKRAEGKRHTQAVLALARRRVDVLYAMMRDGTRYRDPIPVPLTHP
jgi:transposase